MWLPILPPWKTCAWLAPTLVLGVLVVSWLGALLKSRFCLRTGDTRKFFHFSIFTLAAVLSVLHGFAAVNLLGGIVVLVVLAALGLGPGNSLYEALARESDAPHRSLHVAVPLAATAVGGILSISFFGQWATVGMAVGGFADAVAEPIGMRWGRHRYRVPSLGVGQTATRSLEGSAAVFLASLLSAWLVIHLKTDSAARGLSHVVLVAVAVALVSTVVEAVSPHGLDNLTLQLAASATAWSLQ